MDFVKQYIEPIIVTDFSFALINSIMKTFNRLDLDRYLNMCYDFLINKNTNDFFSTKKVKANMKAKFEQFDNYLINHMNILRKS
ncbi:hypothetical protein BpHYR1_009831 [Brachionus plicatilis]|uniref:Uncharacterized protein n=1 Tax=Brachionus plicatilis TaxID=10195 RepID=A0A3M7SPS9_BRAPC|nr:hypothetical protein BpHYR1_009831 [Brachionus plicatilis]